MECRVYLKARASGRLAEVFGLKPDVFERVLLQADAEARNYTALDPLSLPGINRWGRTVRALREELLADGWTYDNPRNLPRTLSPDRCHAIITTLGDEGTGLEDANPSTKYAKGIATVYAIAQNFIQLSMFDEELDNLPLETNEDGLTTWVLLYHVTEHEIRAELSLPDSTTKGRIDTWIERIIFPSLRFDDQVSVIEDMLPAVDVPVARKTS